MKQIVKILAGCLLVIGLSSAHTMAQDPGNFPGASPERVQEMKKEFFVKKLALEKEEAETFWNIYSEFDSKREALRKEHRKPGNPMLLNDEEAEAQLSEIFTFEESMLDLKKEYFGKLESVLNTRQLLYMHHLENEFRKELFERIRSRMAERRGGKDNFKPNNRQ